MPSSSSPELGSAEAPRSASPRVRRRTRWWAWRRAHVAAAIAVAAVVVVIGSDFIIGDFWLAHLSTAAVLGALVVVLLSVTVIDVVITRRAERRWSLLAQYALMELAEAAQAAWAVLADVVGRHDDQPDDGSGTTPITAILDSTDRAPALKSAVEELLADPDRRDALRRSLEDSLGTSRMLISRWAVVMTGSPRYSELFDRHVEMIGRIHGLWYFLVHGVRRGSRFRAPGGSHRDDWFIDNLLAMTRIAIRLERETWAVALEVVPPDWWDRRTDELAAPAHASQP